MTSWKLLEIFGLFLFLFFVVAVIFVFVAESTILCGSKYYKENVE